MDIERRRVIKAFAVLVGATPAKAFSESTPIKELYSDPVQADAWMRSCMDGLGAVSGGFFLGRFADPMYYLLEQINWEPNAGQVEPAVSVPKGFVTDLASIPRIFWSIIPRDGQYAYPAVIHDYLYWEQIVEREIADRIFRNAMADFGVPKPKRIPIFEAVRKGGWVAWKDNANRRKQGEKRVLKRIPDDPTTTWEDWKKRDVF